MNDQPEEEKTRELAEEIQQRIAEIQAVVEEESVHAYKSFLKRPVSIDKGDDAPLWLITFTDIMALMLTFFVLLYSMSVPQEDQWVKLTHGISNSITAFTPPEWYEGAQDTVSIDKVEMRRALNLDYLQTLVKSLRTQNKSLGRMDVVHRQGKVIVSLPMMELFGQDSENEDDLAQGKGRILGDDVTVSGRKALFALGGALSRIRNRIEIVGISPEVAGWQEKLSRFTRVATVLNEVGYERSIIVRSQSDAMGLDQAKDGLVYIVIMPDSGKKL